MELVVDVLYVAMPVLLLYVVAGLVSPLSRMSQLKRSK